MMDKIKLNEVMTVFPKTTDLPYLYGELDDKSQAKISINHIVYSTIRKVFLQSIEVGKEVEISNSESPCMALVWCSSAENEVCCALFDATLTGFVIRESRNVSFFTIGERVSVFRKEKDGNLFVKSLYALSNVRLTLIFLP